MLSDYSSVYFLCFKLGKCFIITLILELSIKLGVFFSLYARLGSILVKNQEEQSHDDENSAVLRLEEQCAVVRLHTKRIQAN